MRDNFSMLPIVQDNNNMHCVPGLKSMSNISSNGYYGYQPCLNKLKAEQEPPCHMEIEHNHEINSRKRSNEHQIEFREFKKRRQNENINNLKEKLQPKDKLLEELLKETHGCPIYHWPSLTL